MIVPLIPTWSAAGFISLRNTLLHLPHLSGSLRGELVVVHSVHFVHGAVFILQIISKMLMGALFE